jgi:hypothetical protein
MPDKNYTQCGRDCLRCWRNRLKHANINHSSAENPIIVYPTGNNIEEQEIIEWKAKEARKNVIKEKKQDKLEKQRERRAGKIIDKLDRKLKRQLDNT